MAIAPEDGVVTDFPSILAQQAADAAANAGIKDAAQYGISEALLADPTYGAELTNVYNLFKAGKTGAALEALFKTKYYTTLSTTVRSRLKQKLEQPEVFQDELNKYVLAQRKRLAGKGVRLDEATFTDLITKAYQSGMDDNQIDAAIIATGKVGKIGGDVLGDVTGLRTYAAAFGVANLYNEKFWESASTDLFAGTTTIEDIQGQIRSLAAETYPAFAEGINNGKSMDIQASYIKQTLATILERDANSFGENDPLFKKFAQFQDPKTGQFVKPPQWLIEREAKKTPDWAFTDNAVATIDTLSLKVLQDMGLM